MKTTDYQRLNARFNVDANFTKFLKTKAEVSFTNNIRTLLDDGVDRFSSQPGRHRLSLLSFRLISLAPPELRPSNWPMPMNLVLRILSE